MQIYAPFQIAFKCEPHPPPVRMCLILSSAEKQRNRLRLEKKEGDDGRLFVVIKIGFLFWQCPTKKKSLS